ncbi:MAG TPA: glycosyltransferase [Opitutaceae bacterium]
MTARPKVSLIMPAFIRDAVNLAYFAEALASARAQTYPNIEILIVNDGSPFTEPLEQLVTAQGGAVRYVKKANGGVASALNVALKEMTGDYFTWLSHDDLYLPDKVAAQMERMARVPADTILYCDVEHIDSHGGHQFFEYTPDVPAGTCRVFFAQYGAFNANAHLIPRHCFDRVGGFDESLRTTQDNHMWYRLSAHFEFRRVPQVLMKYRNHPTQDSRSPIHVKECNELYTYFLEHLDRNDIVRSATVSPARYYAECACVRRNRGYVDAERDATRRALGELLRHPLKERPHLNLIAGLWLTRLRAGERLLMPPKPSTP